MQNINHEIMPLIKTTINLMLVLFLVVSAVFAAGIRENFLSHGPSVSAYGRGETGGAVFEDNASIYYNASLLAETKCSGLVFSEHTLFDGSSYSYAGVNELLSKKGGCLGISLINLRSGDVEIRQNINDSPEIINTNQWAYNLTYARHIKKLFALNLGINLKYVCYDMYKYKGGGAGADIGLSRQFIGPIVFGNKSQVYAGISALNIIQPSVTLISDQESLDTIYRFGISLSLPVLYRVISHDTISLFGDAVLQENMLNPAFGAEYTIVQKYVLRTGYFKDHPTAGLGLKLSGFKIDYAIDFGDLDIINRFLFEYKWGRNRTKTEHKKISKFNSGENLMKEAQQALINTEIDNDKLDKEVGPLFKAALKDYNKKRYLLAADTFRDIMVKFPQYENAGFYYQKIVDDMYEASQLSLDSDFEKVSYARGYVSYRDQRYSDAVNEWEKVLQMNSKRSELNQYVLKVQAYLKDIEGIKKEKEIEERVSILFAEGKSDFGIGKWIASIKTMEKVQNICKNEMFSSSFEWNTKAQCFIDNSISELSKIAYQKQVKKVSVVEEKQPEADIDIEGAERKYNEGLVLYAQGKTEDAVRMWEIAVRFNPKHEKAIKAIEKTKEDYEIKKMK